MIEFLDHVAIRVKDIEKSANWYEKVFDLKKVKLKEWGDIPVFMLAGKTGIALFPANREDPINNLNSKNVKIDHFAFNVTNENFVKAQSKLDNLNIKFDFQDHHYFHSIYIKDLDGHMVELTTMVVDEKEVYK